MYQIQFRPGLCPKPRLGLQRFPRHPSWIFGILLLRGGRGRKENEKKKGRDGVRREKGREKRGGGKTRKEMEHKGWRRPPNTHFWLRNCTVEHFFSNTHIQQNKICNNTQCKICNRRYKSSHIRTYFYTSSPAPNWRVGSKGINIKFRVVGCLKFEQYSDGE